LRHLPELVVILACVGWFFYKRYDREIFFIPAFLVASLLFTLMIRRPNFMYAIYVYPAFLLLILWVFERRGRLWLATALMLLYLLPQYAVVFVQNREWDMDAYIAKVRTLTPDDQATIIGSPNDWFAFKDRSFFVTDYRGDFRTILPENFVLIERDDFRSGAFPNLSKIIDERYDSSRHNSFVSLGETVVIRKLTRKVFHGKNG
jgi:hypothetical protein